MFLKSLLADGDSAPESFPPTLLTRTPQRAIQTLRRFDISPPDSTMNVGLGVSEPLCCCGVRITSAAKTIGILHIVQAVIEILGISANTISGQSYALGGLIMPCLHFLIGFMVVSGVNQEKQERLLPAIILQVIFIVGAACASILIGTLTILTFIGDTDGVQRALVTSLLVVFLLVLAFGSWCLSILITCHKYIKAKKKTIQIPIGDLKV
uniref:Membrane-spanning 4-domains subfamily A member 15-like n=1 Tax=Steinernema glaseri TaxID=37863 RepID=A0A1I8AJL8_9BILA